VRAFRFHYRPAAYRHRVLYWPINNFPAYTIVLSGDVERMWGFWPKPDEFIPFTEWPEATP